MTSSELLRKAALGCLFKGYLHNLRGPLQTLLMQIEILENRLPLSGESEKVGEALSRMKKQVFQIVDLLASAEDDLGREDTGPWSLKELLEKELSFWRAELEFKHKVEKKIDLPEDLRVSFPYNRLRGALCATFFALVFGLAEKRGRLCVSATGGEEGVELNLEVAPALIEPESPYLKAAREILSPEAGLEVNPERVKITLPS
ncbi:hypothetical protein [Thermosulfurimonas sp. F29]|uniref:hypothetical protein n=1 Tax=Thermosulfurimonas sp. F29 TaxID=2867247 RepID=UPI001C833333|nr:hypothetical protein [Thermosulfurimonas sp. F29]MBX6423213.1 hypothetical protein [Thermosulfurimonas sp. F29]